MRFTSSLLSGLPGTIASFSSAASRRSRRNFALRWFLSGPWQAKQFSERIGRMSRLYPAFAADDPAAGEPARAGSEQAVRERPKTAVAEVRSHFLGRANGRIASETPD